MRRTLIGDEAGRGGEREEREGRGAKKVKAATKGRERKKKVVLELRFLAIVNNPDQLDASVRRLLARLPLSLCIAFICCL